MAQIKSLIVWLCVLLGLWLLAVRGCGSRFERFREEREERKEQRQEQWDDWRRERDRPFDRFRDRFRNRAS